MHQVVIGTPLMSISPANEARCIDAAKHLRWSGDQLFIRGQGGEERLVVPWKDRRKLIKDMAGQLGFPGGKRLYQLAKARYYWTSMQRDCIRWCSELAPN